MLVEKPAARTVAELDRLIEAARARPARWSGSASTTATIRRSQKARELVDARRARPADVRPRPLRPRRPRRLRAGVARRSRAVGRRRADRSGRAPHRSGALVPRRLRARRRASRTTYFWEMPVDDNAFLLLRTAGGQAAFLHVSCTEWKNLFSLEIYGRDGKLAHRRARRQLRRRAARATTGCCRRWGRPRRRSGSIPAADQSWALEFARVPRRHRLGPRRRRPASPTARAALAVVETIYARSGYHFAPR